eukprot:scaffold63270_cov15-Tisochrysis_lutea.AAC.2
MSIFKCDHCSCTSQDDDGSCIFVFNAAVHAMAELPFPFLRREYLGLTSNPIEPAMKLLMFCWAAIV